MTQQLAQVFCISQHPVKNEETGKMEFALLTAPPPIVEYAEKWHKSILKFCLLRGTQDISDQHEIAIAVNLTLQKIEDEIPIKFVKVGPNDNPDLTFEWIAAKDDPVFVNNPTATAYSGFPDANGTAIHIRLNDDFNWSFSGTNFQFNPLNTLLHEMGHCMGLVHSPDCPLCIMYNFYNGVIELAVLDIARYVAKYGARVWSNGAYLRMKLAVAAWSLRLR